MRLSTIGPLDLVTAGAVAADVGVSKALVFHYFPTQRDLQSAIADAAASDMLAMFRSIDGEQDHATQLRQGLELFVSFVELRPASYATIARGAGTDPQLNAVFERSRSEIVSIIATALGLESPSDQVRMYMRGWIALCEETILQWIATRAVERDDLIEFLHTTAFDIIARAVVTLDRDQ